MWPVRAVLVVSSVRHVARPFYAGIFVRSFADSVEGAPAANTLRHPSKEWGSGQIFDWMQKRWGKNEPPRLSHLELLAQKCKTRADLDKLFVQVDRFNKGFKSFDTKFSSMLVHACLRCVGPEKAHDVLKRKLELRLWPSAALTIRTAKALRRNGKAEEALRLLENLAQQEKIPASAYVELMVASAGTKNPDKALELLTDAPSKQVKLSPGVYPLLMATMLRAENYDAALNVASRAPPSEKVQLLAAAAKACKQDLSELDNVLQSMDPAIVLHVAQTVQDKDAKSRLLAHAESLRDQKRFLPSVEKLWNELRQEK